MLINDIITNVMGYLNDFYNNDNGIEKEEKYRYCNLEIRDLAVYKEFLDKYCFT